MIKKQKAGQWFHSQRVGHKSIVKDFVDVPKQLPIEDFEKKYPEYAHHYRRSE